MTPEQELEMMLNLNPSANNSTHMLVDGNLLRRCWICGKNPIPNNAGSVMWCDPCVTEFLAGDESILGFTDRKRAAKNAEMGNTG